MISILGQALPLLLYLVVGLCALVLLRWRQACLFDVLLGGYLAVQVPFMAIAWITERGLPALVVSIVFLVAMLAWVCARQAARIAVVDTFRTLRWEDGLLLVAVMAVIGWPFYGPLPAAPWGTANNDLVDAFAGGQALFSRPDLVGLYKDFSLGGTAFGQYCASGLAQISACAPDGLLADYHHLVFLLALLALGIANLARDGLELGRWWSIGAGTLVGVSCLLTTTVHNGHVGSTMFLPIAVFLIRLAFIRPAPQVSLWIAGLIASLEVVGSYLYPAPLFILAAGVMLIPWLMNQSWCPPVMRRLGTPGLLVLLFVLGVVFLIFVYPYCAGHRLAALEKYRAWAVALRGDMIGIALGSDPTGLNWTSRFPHQLVSPMVTWCLAFVVSALVLLGAFRIWTTALGRYLIGSLAMATAMAVSVAIVIMDSYYVYKVIYITSPFVWLVFVAGLHTRARWIAFAAAPLLLFLIGLNVRSTTWNALEFTSSSFNRLQSEVGEVSTQISALKAQNIVVTAPVTGGEYANIMELLNRRDDLQVGMDRWIYSKSIMTAMQLSFTDASKNRYARRRQMEELTLNIGTTSFSVTPLSHPEIMTFPGLPPGTIWRNAVWRIDDWSKVPTVTMFSYFGGVSRYSFSLHGHPFRWMRDGVFVKVDRWPTDRQRLSFFAEAGYGSTSGRFDLRVLVNTTELMREVIETPGRLYEVLIPVDLIGKTNVIAFVGDPLPGPPLNKREFVNMRARIANIRVTTLDAPAWDRESLALFNGETGVVDVPGPEGGAALGAGWGEVEYSAGRPLHWLTQRPAQIVILDRKPNQAILRLAGAPGPACPLDKTITVASSAGWTRRVIVRDRELVVPLGDPPVDGCEVLLLTASNPVPTLPSFDSRSLVFRLDRLELTP